MSATPFADLPALAKHFREELEKPNKRFVLLYAYNGTGKTRLSGAFRDLGKKAGDRDTLYFNAFTEDLFYWDNDLEHDRERVLKMNAKSHYFDGLRETEINALVRPLMRRYATVDFQIDKLSDEEWEASFSRDVLINGRLETIEDIKVSRGEENIFIWCFFLAITQLALDGAEAYKWVKYIYADDPISSLDEHNAITVANQLAQMLLKSKSPIKTIISSHHTLFFNVMGNELKKAKRCLLCRGPGDEGYLLRNTGNTPFFQHVANLVELDPAQKAGKLYTHHFNILRSILEKTASFHGYGNFGQCVRPTGDDSDKTLHTRIVNIMSHGNYSLFEPIEMVEENKALFKAILDDFRKNFPFNPDPFNETSQEADAE